MIRDGTSPYSVAVWSEKATVFQINMESIIKLQMSGIDNLGPVRAQARMRENWIRFKCYRLREAEIESTNQRIGNHAPDIVSRSDA